MILSCMHITVYLVILMWWCFICEQIKCFHISTAALEEVLRSLKLTFHIAGRRRHSQGCVETSHRSKKMTRHEIITWLIWTNSLLFAFIVWECLKHKVLFKQCLKKTHLYCLNIFNILFKFKLLWLTDNENPKFSVSENLNIS